MIKDITIGQYYPEDSYIHKLDPRTKIISSLLFIASIFLIKKLYTYLIVILALVIVIHASKVPFKFMLRGLKSIFMIILVTVVINMFLTQGEQVIFNVLFLTVTYEGVYMAAMMAMRLILLIIGSSILTLTTSPINLTDGLECLMAPLKKIGVPAGEIAMMMTIALRFIPTLLEESDKIMKAQMARGADFDTGGIIKKAKCLLPLLIPLFVSALRRADELALAMEARCYNGEKQRTKMKKIEYTKSDYKAYIYLSLYLLILILFFYVD